MSGSWVTGRPPSAEPGSSSTSSSPTSTRRSRPSAPAGGEVLNEDAAPGERVGILRDPAGNVIGIYQQPGLAERERTVTPVPEHLHTVTPRLALSDAAAGIDFYKAAFNAKELGERYHMPDGTLVHAELLIGDSVVMVKDAQDDEFNALLWPVLARRRRRVGSGHVTSANVIFALRRPVLRRARWPSRRSVRQPVDPAGSKSSRPPSSRRETRRRARPSSLSDGHLATDDERTRLARNAWPGSGRVGDGPSMSWQPLVDRSLIATEPAHFLNHALPDPTASTAAGAYPRSGPLE